MVPTVRSRAVVAIAAILCTYHDCIELAAPCDKKGAPEMRGAFTPATSELRWDTGVSPIEARYLLTA